MKKKEKEKTVKAHYVYNFKENKFLFSFYLQCIKKELIINNVLVLRINYISKIFHDLIFLKSQISQISPFLFD